MKALISILSVFIVAAIGFSQTEDLASAEVKLEKLLQDLRSAENDADKEAKNKIFKTELEKALQNREAMTYPFASLSTVGFIDSPDGQMRIVNWNIEQDDLSQKYGCFVLHIDKRKKTYHVTELIDASFGMPMQPTEIIPSNQWYGALYYKIIPVKKGSKMLYTVLGWDYFSSMSQIRVIDVIYFTGKTVKLGSPIFKIGKETHKRMIFEHSKKASMTLTYEESRGRIMMDHLSPESPSMKNFKSFYVPDMTYDAFVLQGYKWILHEDVIGVNPEDEEKKQVVYVKNEKTGKVERKVIKVKWENPEDLDAPAGGSEHVAVTPESAAEEAELEKEKNTPKADKRDKRDPSNPSFYDDINKKKRKRNKKKRSRN